MSIDKHPILAELERLLASPSFRSRKLIKKFLHYVVQETLDGRGDSLNQYSIALHALGKPADFSPFHNPVVRIEAGRLRKLLDAYYRNSANHGMVMIKMPKGSYQVEFSFPAQQTAAITPQPAQATGVVRITEGPRLFVHFQMLHGEDSTLYPLLYKLRGDLLLMLSRFRNIRLVSSVSPRTDQTLTQKVLQQTWEQYQADYILNCDIRPHTGGVDLCYTLAHTRSDELAWQSIITLPAQPTQDDLDGMCREVAASTVSVHSGIALHHWAQYLRNSPAIIPAHQRVLVDYLGFLHNITRESFAQTLATCQQRLQQFPEDSKALVILSRLCGYEHVLQYGLIEDLDGVWTHAARMAMKFDPGNAEAHSVFAHNSYFRGDYTLCRIELEIARQANPFDMSGEYLYGMGLYFLGDKDAFLFTINRLLSTRFTQPDWYHVLPFLYHFNQGDYAQALHHAERIQRFGFWGELARCVSYFHLGQHERAKAELLGLTAKNPAVRDARNASQFPFAAHPAFNKIWDTMGVLLAK
jgi:tetratricopeptide (TPR) repeat protein